MYRYRFSSSKSLYIFLNYREYLVLCHIFLKCEQTTNLSIFCRICSTWLFKTIFLSAENKCVQPHTHKRYMAAVSITIEYSVGCQQQIRNLLLFQFGQHHCGEYCKLEQTFSSPVTLKNINVLDVQHVFSIVLSTQSLVVVSCC